MNKRTEIMYRLTGESDTQRTPVAALFPSRGRLICKSYVRN